MSEVKVNKISPRSGTAITLGDSGDTFTIPSGATLAIAGSVTGFTSAGIDDNATSTAITISSDEDVTFTEDIKLGDGKKAIFGAGSDFEILHNSVTGNLFNLAANPLEIHQAGTNSVLQLYRDPGNGVIAQFYGGTTQAGSINTDTVSSSPSLEISAVGAFAIRTNNGSERMRILSDGKVGIGTASPARQLTVSGSASPVIAIVDTGTSGSPSLFFGDSSADNVGKIQYSNSNNSLATVVNGSERMRITSAGLVGIGTSSPDTLLHLSSTNPVITFQETDQSNRKFQIGSFGNAYAIYDASNSQYRYILDNGGNHIFNEGGLDCDFRVESNNNANMLFIDGNSDRVGIGTSSPTQKLDVSGTVKATSFSGDGSALTGISGGKVLQVIQTVKTDAFTTTATSMTDVTGFSVSITPSSTSSKILVMINVSMIANNGANGSLINLLRGSTSLTSSSAGGSADTNNAWNVGGGGGMTNNNRKYNSPSISFLDSPSSTSSLTYKCQMMVNGGSTTAYFNRWALNTDHAGVSTITVMEIQG